MARSASFGDILRDARIRQGLDVTTVARHLRIRPDILMAIEDCDFSLMPPRGYSKSMITGYARMLGLNSNELVRMYQDDLYAYEIGRVRSDTSRRPQRNTRDSQRSARSSRRSDRGQSARASRGEANLARTSHDSGEEQLGRGRVRMNLRDHQPSGRTYNSNRVHTSRNISLPNSQYTNLVAAPKNVSNGGGSKLPFIIAGAVLVVILLLVLFVFNGKDDNTTEDLPDVPVSGLTDTSTPVDNTANNVPTPPTDAEFEFEILEGEEAYYEIYVDDAEKPSKAGTLAGPISERYDVSGKLRFVTARPSAVNVTVNGEPVTLTDEDENGVYEYTVDFSKILAQWQADNQAAIDAANAAAQEDTSTTEDEPAAE